MGDSAEKHGAEEPQPKEISRESTRKTRIIFLVFNSRAFVKFAAAFLSLIANGITGQSPKAKGEKRKGKPQRQSQS
jgi:hypothetical protein